MPKGLPVHGLPLHYGRGLLEIYAIIWVAAGVAIAIREWRDRRGR
jgi:hypothetical protein